MLRDAAGRPVANGEAAVVVVDEAVLALTGYRLPDPLEVFYARRGPDVSDHRLRAHVLLARPEDFAPPTQVADALSVGGVMEMVAAPAPAGAAPQRMARGKAMSAEEDKAAEPIRARTDFSALALFAASVPTDSEGRAHVPVKLPDSLTRYRVMAVAVEGERRFGSGEATIVARLPLMVRPSAPRFLNFGDRFELPVVVQNQTDGEMTVDVAVRALNAALTAGAGRRLVGGRERPRRGALPHGRGARGLGTDPGRGCLGYRRRRGRGRAARLDAGDHRGLRHVRADRRRVGRAAREGRRPVSCRTSAGSKSRPPRPRSRPSPTPSSTSWPTPSSAPSSSPRASSRWRRCATC